MEGHLSPLIPTEKNAFFLARKKLLARPLLWRIVVSPYAVRVYVVPGAPLAVNPYVLGAYVADYYQ